MTTIVDSNQQFISVTSYQLRSDAGYYFYERMVSCNPNYSCCNFDLLLLKKLPYEDPLWIHHYHELAVHLSSSEKAKDTQ